MMIMTEIDRELWDAGYIQTLFNNLSPTIEKALEKEISAKKKVLDNIEDSIKKTKKTLENKSKELKTHQDQATRLKYMYELQCASKKKLVSIVSAREQAVKEAFINTMAGIIPELGKLSIFLSLYFFLFVWCFFCLFVRSL